jgi:hypothetical protein
MILAAVALAVALGDQSAPVDRVRAEQLARAGHTMEAIALFERLVEADPADVDARLWIARLDVQLGRTDKAEAAFRSVMQEHPADVDARLGLGSALLRKGDWPGALAILRETEHDAGENADLLGALGRAYRRAGDDRSALAYFARAKALSPADPDLVAGYEATAQAYGHSILVEGFGEPQSTGVSAGSGALTVTLRATPRAHVNAYARAQQRSGSSDTVAGGGIRLRAGRATTLEADAAGGSGNTSLPNGNVSANVVHYAGPFEIGGSVRMLAFAGVDVAAVSPTFAWDTGGPLRLDGRYTYSRSSFDASGATSGDHSVALRDMWRAWPRTWLTASYAYGIESFEQLTADRVGSLGASTLAGGVRISAPSLSIVTATWEHQWRSNGTSIDRLTLAFVQTFP